MKRSDEKAGSGALVSARDALRKLAADFERALPGVRAGFDPEALHDLRVAMRRLRAALAVFRAALPPAWIRAVRREIRWIAEYAGRVRDLDVGIGRIRAWSEHQPEDVRAGVEAWIAELGIRRARARAALALRLDSRRLLQFRRRLSRDLAGPLRTAAVTGKATAGILRRRYRRADAAAGALALDSPDAAFHETRIRIKKLRYAVEFFSTSDPKTGRTLIRRLIRLQDALGRHQDAIMVSGLLLDPLRTRPAPDAGLEGARSALLAYAAAEIEKNRREFLEVRRVLAARKTRAWIRALSPRA